MWKFGPESFVFPLLPKNIKVKTHRALFCLFIIYSYVCETWLLSLREQDCWLREFENRRLRNIFGLKVEGRGKKQETWEKRITRSVMIFSRVQTLFGYFNQERWVGRGNVARVGQKRNSRRILIGKPKEKGSLEDRHARIILKWMTNKYFAMAWTGLTWLRTWTPDGVLRIQWWIFSVCCIFFIKPFSAVLGAYAKPRKATVGFVMCVFLTDQIWLNTLLSQVLHQTVQCF